jgi:hypothetical protein
VAALDLCSVTDGDQRRGELSSVLKLGDRILLLDHVRLDAPVAILP